MRLLSDTISADPGYAAAYTCRALGQDDLAQRDIQIANRLEAKET